MTAHPRRRPSRHLVHVDHRAPLALLVERNLVRAEPVEPGTIALQVTDSGTAEQVSDEACHAPDLRLAVVLVRRSPLRTRQ